MPTTRAKRLRKSSGTLATVLASAALARVITHFVLHPDADVFVVGDELDDERVRLGLAERTLAVAGLLGRVVNVTRYTYDRLVKRSAEGSRFVREVLAGDKD